jgi:hypothetical protein
LSYRATREKYKKRLLTAYGPAYLPDHNVPSTLKFSYPGGKMSPSCNIEMDVWQPSFLGEAIRTPSWFDASAIVAALERIIADKVSPRHVPTNAELLTLSALPFSEQEAVLGQPHHVPIFQKECADSRRAHGQPRSPRPSPALHRNARCTRVQVQPPTTSTLANGPGRRDGAWSACR